MAEARNDMVEAFDEAHGVVEAQDIVEACDEAYSEASMVTQKARPMT